MYPVVGFPLVSITLAVTLLIPGYHVRALLNADVGVQSGNGCVLLTSFEPPKGVAKDSLCNRENSHMRPSVSDFVGGSSRHSSPSRDFSIIPF